MAGAKAATYEGAVLCVNLPNFSRTMPGNLLVMAALGLGHLRLVVFFGRNVFASAANGCAAWLVVVLTEESLNRFVLCLDIVPTTLLIVPVKLF